MWSVSLVTRGEEDDVVKLEGKQVSKRDVFQLSITHRIKAGWVKCGMYTDGEIVQDRHESNMEQNKEACPKDGGGKGKEIKTYLG